MVFDIYYSESLTMLADLEGDGLVAINDDEICFTEYGRLFLRDIAKYFDRYIRRIKTDRQFLKTV